MRVVLFFAMAVAVAAIFTLRAAEQFVKADEEFIRPFPIVGIKRGASDAEKVAAKEIANAIGKAGFVEAERNPVCCIWIEVTGWTPSPGEPGYFIIHQAGGSIISASNEEQLKQAVEQFKKSARKIKGGIEVPAGMMTSFRIAATATAGR